MGVRTTYRRVCSSCGDVSTITYKPKAGVKCKSCSGKENVVHAHTNNKKEEKDLVRYSRTCIDCNETHFLKCQPRSDLCGDCSRKRTGLANKGKPRKIKPKIDKNGLEVRFFRVCPDCPPEVATIQVSSKKHSGIKPCKKHMAKYRRPRGKKANPIAKSNIVGGYDGRQKVKVKFQVVDLETFEEPKRLYKKKEIDIGTPEDNARMVEEYLAKSKPSVTHHPDELWGETTLKSYMGGNG